MSKRPWAFVVGGLLVALLLAGVVSNYASSHPDGLDSSLLKGCTVDADHTITGGSCPAQQAKDHELADSPLADYGVRGIDNAFVSTGLSGVLGVLLTFAIGGGAFWLIRRRNGAAAANTADPTAAGPTDEGGTPAGAVTGGGAERS
ncbi:PDGLE domain-containing protein [Micromonospora krabiensis]|uniref:Cobalt/nickel transport protein n=1 Tax=Micromonospora krabiensis TaxID=307121 RepID=A0A1C3N4V9_9ACTN|nr:PDGLE domain-containing protein [Micromonospora krabiensis]SBV27608.1 cobalt/nickel transport protein [Micromonospora krabiensis]